MSKRLLASVATTAALSALIAGATFALFTDTAENSGNTFTAGTVSLGELTPFTCDISDVDNLAPGDSGQCTVSVQYRGSLDAFVGVDVEASGALFEGDTPIVYQISAPKVDGTYVLGEFSNGEDATVTIDWTFPLEAGNEYQGATGQIDLTFKAVQSRNNGSGNGAPNSWN